ncbi:4-galactosyl-N-acetylglucosaminide 3-alpha-L-fucosyltransferase FUT5-like [Styela clava]
MRFSIRSFAISFSCFLMLIIFIVKLLPPQIRYKVFHQSNYEETVTTTKQKIILFWGTPTFLQHFLVIPKNLSTACGGCIVTSDRNYLNDSDVLLFHPEYFSKYKKIMPPTRLANHIYVFMSGENPYYTRYAIKERMNFMFNEYDTIFNMTVSYRRDADIVANYGIWHKDMLKTIQPFTLKKKTNLAIMLASECWRAGSQLRIKLSDALVEEGLNLTRYGKCFGSRYEGNLTELLHQYKFFMSFENAIHCKDYLTEKFWVNSLWNGVVPVVWGPLKEDIVRVAPPNSFIFVDDFESLKDLVQYLNYLDKNDDEYLKYFAWRNLEPPERQPNIYCACGKMNLVDEKLCGLCRTVTDGSKGKSNLSLSEWWYGGENPECLQNNLTHLELDFNKQYGIK